MGNHYEEPVHTARHTYTIAILEISSSSIFLWGREMGDGTVDWTSLSGMNNDNIVGL